MEWIVLESPEAVAVTAKAIIMECAADAICQRGRFNIALAGGSTPETTYRLLAKENMEWQHWHLYFGDERCLPADHGDRNSVMVERSLTDHVPIPADQIHPIAAELGADKGAAEYHQTIRNALPFDLVLLGLGEDGHTASLFPGQPTRGNRLVLPVHNAPKPPAERVSLSTDALGQHRNLLFLVTGAGKSSAVKAWRSGQSLPVASVPCNINCRVLLDQAANSQQ
jgi:6-phosphogluconolactonase